MVAGYVRDDRRRPGEQYPTLARVFRRDAQHDGGARRGSNLPGESHRHPTIGPRCGRAAGSAKPRYGSGNTGDTTAEPATTNRPRGSPTATSSHQTGSSGYLEGTFIVPDEAGAGASGTIEIHLIPPSSRCGGTGTGNRCPVGSTVGGVNRSTNKLCIAVERSGDIAHPCSSGQTQVEAPTIEGTPRLSASGGDGAWTPGETVEATVTFSEAVTVDGTPTIGLMLGGTQKQSASYRSGSGTRELVFAYTLSESDGSHTAMGVALDSLALNGGSITSEATGADAELSHDGTIITGTRDDGRGVRELPRPTAQFSEVPATHDGATAFEVTLSISEAPGLDEGAVRGALEVSCASESCATVTGASRVTDRQWTVTVEPSQAYAITLRLPARACGETGAVCIGGRALAGTGIGDDTGQSAHRDPHPHAGRGRCEGRAQGKRHLRSAPRVQHRAAHELQDGARPRCSTSPAAPSPEHAGSPGGITSGSTSS